MKRQTYTKKDFAWAVWTPAELSDAADKAIAKKKKAYADLSRIPARERTFENTIYAIEASSQDIRDMLGIIEGLLNLSPRVEVRNAARKASIKIRAALVDLEYDPRIYRAFREYADKRESLAGADKKLLEDMRRDLRRMGFELPSQKQALLKRRLKELQKFETIFSENLNKYQDHITISGEELAGLPERFVNGLRKEGGKFIVSLDYPEFFPFMQLAESSKKRKELAEKNLKKGGIGNLRLVEKMLRIRYENARLLGYADHASFQTEPRMARNANTVLNFQKGLIAKIRSAARKELDDLQQLKKELTGDTRMEWHDLSYYGEKMRQHRHKLKSEAVREYFPMETVKRGMFGIYERLLSLKFRRMRGIPTWHEEVEVWEARYKEGGIAGYFMLDLYPRPNKYGHAAASSAINGRALGFRASAYRTPISVMMTNFPRPTKDNPSLMSHGDVETFFHEFGHVMHQILTTAAYASQSGSNTVLDFVEAQSQMLENWVWKKNSLRLMSGHYRTGKPLPAIMLKKLLGSKKHMVAYFALRQLIMGLLDMELHTGRPRGNPAKLYAELMRKYAGMKLPGTSLFPAGFGHIGGGYDAGYYGYLWSLVYAQDMFTKFEAGGIMNPRVGRSYRREILEVGSSRKEMESVVAFLGRKPNNKAFLRELGISKK